MISLFVILLGFFRYCFNFWEKKELFLVFKFSILVLNVSIISIKLLF